MINDTGKVNVLPDDEFERFNAVTMAVVALSITHEAETFPMRAPLQRVGETGTLLI
jgi:hypothetical protein